MDEVTARIIIIIIKIIIIKIIIILIIKDNIDRFDFLITFTEY